eukprot:c18325_g1_i1 orf=40-387(-)
MTIKMHWKNKPLKFFINLLNRFYIIHWAFENISSIYEIILWEIPSISHHRQAWIFFVITLLVRIATSIINYSSHRFTGFTIILEQPLHMDWTHDLQHMAEGQFICCPDVPFPNSC